MELGSGLFHVARLAALAGHRHSYERPLALLVVCAVAFNAFVLQPIAGAASATKARCCQKPFTLAALLFLRHLALPAAVCTLPARTACQAGACSAARVELGCQIEPSGWQVAAALDAGLWLVRWRMLVLGQPVQDACHSQALTKVKGWRHKSNAGDVDDMCCWGQSSSSYVKYEICDQRTLNMAIC
jgi:hypothetical protein